MTHDSLFLTSAFPLIDLIKHPNNECIFNAYFFFLMIWVVRYEAEFSFCYLTVDIRSTLWHFRSFRS